jgi:cytochrome d ubiquinol oxidase subunit I
MGALVTGAFAMAAVGAYWTLRGEHAAVAALSLRTGVLAGLVVSVLVAVPTGHLQGRLVARYQPVTLAAMEGHFEGGPRAPLAMIGQPDVANMRLDNPVHLPAVLSYIAYGDFSADVELLYYAFHIMVGLGTLFIALMALATLQLVRRRLGTSRPLLWVVALAFPFPFIANTAGWLSAELGRQPWVVHGLMRTAEGGSPTVHGGATLFTLLGFAGLYFVLGLLFLSLVGREVAHGPPAAGAHV